MLVVLLMYHTSLARGLSDINTRWNTAATDYSVTQHPGWISQRSSFQNSDSNKMMSTINTALNEYHIDTVHLARQTTSTNLVASLRNDQTRWYSNQVWKSHIHSFTHPCFEQFYHTKMFTTEQVAKPILTSLPSRHIIATPLDIQITNRLGRSLPLPIYLSDNKEPKISSNGIMTLPLMLSPRIKYLNAQLVDHGMYGHGCPGRR